MQIIRAAEMREKISQYQAAINAHEFTSQAIMRRVPVTYFMGTPYALLSPIALLPAVSQSVRVIDLTNLLHDDARGDELLGDVALFNSALWHKSERPQTVDGQFAPTVFALYLDSALDSGLLLENGTVQVLEEKELVINVFPAP